VRSGENSIGRLWTMATLPSGNLGLYYFSFDVQFDELLKNNFGLNTNLLTGSTSSIWTGGCGDHVYSGTFGNGLNRGSASKTRVKSLTLNGGFSVGCAYYPENDRLWYGRKRYGSTGTEDNGLSTSSCRTLTWCESCIDHWRFRECRRPRFVPIDSYGVQVRALSRNPDAANFPSEVEVVRGDLTIPDSLEAALQDVDAVFLVWTAPGDTAAAVLESIAKHAGRIVFSRRR